jgi:C_GCAxxG_C_C family probable redox protein
MFLAVGEHLLGRVDDRMVRMALAFLGGVGATHQELCGALSAGVMVIGDFLGPRYPGEDEKPMRRTIALYRERFLNEIGSTTCAVLRDGLYGKNGKEPCSVLVQRSIRILFAVLEQSSKDLPDGL